MSESEQEIPKLSEVPPDQIVDVLKLLQEAGLYSEGKSVHPFELRIKLTENREVDVHVIWDCDVHNVKDVATILEAATSGTLNKQILMALNYLAGNDSGKSRAIKQLVRKWNRAKDSHENRSFIDSFQPLLPPEDHR